LYKAGARPAQAGEFTRRAFVNGKMDLTGAEAVMDLIAADGKLAAKTALAAKEGATFRALTKVKEELLGVAAQFAAFVDYPDEDIPALSDTALLETLQKGEQTLVSLLSTFDAGRVLREGIDTVIVGAPNVGKSTLMNALSGCERSIVTPIAGTTRDIVEETVKLGEVTLRLSDTAGIRETGDLVESIGVEKALTRAKSASLILAVFDGSRPFTDADRRLVETIKQETVIAIINKGDLPCALDEAELTAHFPYVVHLSAQNGDGVAALTEAVEQVTGVCRLQEDTPLLATERQRLEAENALSAIREGLTALQCGITHDAVNVCVDDALSAILSLTGEKATEAVVDEVFSRFCVGK
jgi:tRNA modification GTPase